MVHRFELKLHPGWPQGGDPVLVKEFSRSAAGSESACKPQELRPGHVCRRAAVHLIGNVFLPNLRDKAAYDFVFDRLRAVRQDMAVQELRDLKVLEICVKFHLVSGYLFLTATDVDFDGHLNFCHLLECLKTVLIVYQDLDLQDSPLADEMTAIYLLLNLGSSHAILWALGLGLDRRQSPAIDLAMRINLQYLERNFVAMFKLVKRLDFLPLIALHWTLPSIYR